MDDFGVEQLSLTFGTLTITPPMQSTRGSGRMDSEEGVGASLMLGLVTLFRNFMKHFGGGGHKPTDVLELRESPSMEMPAAEEHFRKLLSQKEKEMEDAAKVINDLLTQKDELSESASQSNCRNLQVQYRISLLEQEGRRLYQEGLGLWRCNLHQSTLQ